MKTKTHFAFPVDIWDDVGDSIVSTSRAWTIRHWTMKVAGTNKPEGKGYISAGCSAACSTRLRISAPRAARRHRGGAQGPPLEGLPLPIRRPPVHFFDEFASAVAC